jgi:cytochrome bd-type quinol oxidase subunit 2
MNVALSRLSGPYRPTTFMLVGLILRGAAFDFRGRAKAKAKAKAKAWQAASSLFSLSAILIAMGVTLLILAGRAGFAYRVFRGKTIELNHA